MPVIKPFKAILPNLAHAKEVVIGLENLTISSAKEIGQLNPISFVHLLVPKIENYYLRGSKQELAFQKIIENFDDFKTNHTSYTFLEKNYLKAEPNNDSKTIALIEIGEKLILNATYNNENNGVRPSYYQVKYQDKIDQMTLANQLSSKATLEVEGNEILLTFPRESVGTSGEIAFYRPSNPAFDFKLPLTISDTALVMSAPKTMQKGLWEAHISWKKEGKTYLERIKFQR